MAEKVTKIENQRQIPISHEDLVFFITLSENAQVFC